MTEEQGDPTQEIGAAAGWTRWGRSPGRLLQIGVPGVSTVLLWAALVQPAVTIQRTDAPEGPHTYGGMWLLGFGWAGMFLDWIGFVWFASPVLMVGLLLAGARHWRVALFFTAIAIALAAPMFAVDSFGRWATDPEFRFNLNSLQSGFYLWFAAITVAFVGSMAGLVVDRSQASASAVPAGS